MAAKQEKSKDKPAPDQQDTQEVPVPAFPDYSDIDAADVAIAEPGPNITPGDAPEDTKSKKD